MTQQAAQSNNAINDPDPHRFHVLVITLIAWLTLPVIIASWTVFNPGPKPGPWAQHAAQLGVQPIDLATGEHYFKKTCAVCHGADAGGRLGLGKPLRNSEFVQTHSDFELMRVIVDGRLPTDEENTTGTPMPARGGNPVLNDERLQQVVHYLRTLQNLDEPPVSLDAWITSTTAQSGGDQVAGIVGESGGVGHDVFVASCSACHGTQGQGVEGLGKPLDTSAFIEGKSDEELLTFLKTGRPIWDPENTTGIDMPAKGGNPALGDEDLQTIIKYIRALHADPNG